MLALVNCQSKIIFIFHNLLHTQVFKITHFIFPITESYTCFPLSSPFWNILCPTSNCSNKRRRREFVEWLLSRKIATELERVDRWKHNIDQLGCDFAGDDRTKRGGEKRKWQLMVSDFLPSRTFNFLSFP